MGLKVVSVHKQFHGTKKIMFLFIIILMCIHTGWKMEHKLVCNFCKQGTYLNIIYILIISILFLLKIMYIQLFES